ncbi:hypothetical protein L3Y34_014341 [Caenorhabditis briggsae]|uniref:Uncharacterized protein n=1 Tax=Caenorhabditis briggsae TaxID=6238 RepID=A0AAE9DRD0_CAEBR|nr:hypothetical protein L3Y34_014341 [Caenorhabditis briggsae]
MASDFYISFWMKLEQNSLMQTDNHQRTLSVHFLIGMIRTKLHSLSPATDISFEKLTIEWHLFMCGEERL